MIDLFCPRTRWRSPAKSCIQSSLQKFQRSHSYVNAFTGAFRASWYTNHHWVRHKAHWIKYMSMQGKLGVRLPKSASYVYHIFLSFYKIYRWYDFLWIRHFPHSVWMRIDFTELFNKLMAFINHLEMAFHGFRYCQMVYIVGTNKWEPDARMMNTCQLNLPYMSWIQHEIGRASCRERV